MKCYQWLLRASLTDFCELCDSYAAEEVWMQMNGAQMSRPGQTGKWMTVIFHVWLRMKEISHVAERKTAECRPDFHEWNGKAFKWCCFVPVFLPGLCSCSALFKLLRLCLVHLLLPPTSCFAVVVLIVIVCVRMCGWCVVNNVYTMVRQTAHDSHCKKHRWWNCARWPWRVNSAALW